MTPFIGRKRELMQLKDLLSRDTASLVVVKGRRRIGKSRLIEEFGKGFKSVTLSGLSPTKKTTSKHQREEFAREMARIFQIPFSYQSDWSDLFWHLAEQTKRGRVIILLDEISWMGSKDPTFLGKLKNAWDLHFKKNPKLILVLCGSVSSWIEKNILSSTGFVGRVDLTLTLGELTLPECNEFWGAQKEQISANEKFKLLAVTGGVPRYLEVISPKKIAEDNIKRLCFTQEGFFYNEFDKTFHDLFTQHSEIYQQILFCLIKHPMAELDDIFRYLKMKKSGVLSQYLNDLISAGFVRRDYTWAIHSGLQSKLSHFRICDNYVRFYLKYIFPNKDKIARDAFVNRSLSTLPGWESIMGFQFENLVLQNRHLVQQLLHIDPAEIVNDNPYFQRNTVKQNGCQIDYMIQTRFNCLYLCEIKFLKNPVQMNVVLEMKKKINNLSLPKNFSYRPVLIHVSGVDDDVIASELFANIIDFGRLLQLV